MEFPNSLKSPDPTTTLLLAVLNLLATYITNRCITPPNTTLESTSQPTDRVKWATSPLFLALHRLIIILIGLSHTLLTLFSPSFSTFPSYICPHPSHPSPSVFSLTPYTALLVLLILSFGPLRLLCYASLGRNFTFQLRTPGKLTTGGIYRYVQHPSYTCQIVVLLAFTFLTCRRDGVMGCWLPGWVIESETVGTGIKVAVAAGLVGGFWGLGLRIRDEERMLRARFGTEWEEWHARTKRFVPGVF